jgi:hypothetical protein
MAVLMVVISFYLYDVGFICLVPPPPHKVTPETVTVLLSAVVRVCVDRSARWWCVVSRCVYGDDHQQGGHDIRSLFIISSFLFFITTITKS